MTTNEYIRRVRDGGWTPFPKRLWQRNYYEHVIRGNRSLDRIRRYIADNPSRWNVDHENPYTTGHDDEWDALFQASAPAAQS